MLYGPNHQEVQAFIETLPSFNCDDWEASKDHSLDYEINLYEDLDEASITVVLALQTYPVLDQALTAAKAATLAVFDRLNWPSETQREAKQDVLYALGALVVFNSVDFDKIVARFWPFRFSKVAIPVQWGS